MGEKLLAACEAALEGDLPETKKGLEEAGKRGADGIREYIDGQIPPPNRPVTLTGGWIYNRVAKKGVQVGGKNGSTPLVDTGQLRDDFDWEIREKQLPGLCFKANWLKTNRYSSYILCRNSAGV